MLFFAVVYVTFAIVLSGNSIKKQPQRNENLVFLQTRTDRMFSVPRLFWPRWRQNYFIVFHRFVEEIGPLAERTVRRIKR